MWTYPVLCSGERANQIPYRNYLRKDDSVCSQFRPVGEDDAGLGEPCRSDPTLNLDSAVGDQVCAALVLPWREIVRVC